MSVAVAPFMAAVPEPFASTGFLDILVTALPDSGAMVGLVATRPRFGLVVNRISTAPTTPNVVQTGHAAVAQDLNHVAPSVLTLMNVNKLPASAGQRPHAPIPKGGMNAAASLPYLEILLLSHAKVNFFR